MDEKELKALKEEVYSTPIEPGMERLWIHDQKQALETEEQKLMAQFGMLEFVRDDANMTRVATALKRARSMLAYLRDREKSLERG